MEEFGKISDNSEKAIRIWPQNVLRVQGPRSISSGSDRETVMILISQSLILTEDQDLDSAKRNRIGTKVDDSNQNINGETNCFAWTI